MEISGKLSQVRKPNGPNGPRAALGLVNLYANLPLDKSSGQEGAEAKAGEGKKKGAVKPAPKKANKAGKAKKAVAKAKKAAA